MKILVTGVAGFIGAKVAEQILRTGNKIQDTGYRIQESEVNKNGNEVVGIDNLNDYYDVNLKEWRLNQLRSIPINRDTLFKFYKIDIEDFSTLQTLFAQNKFDAVINLAARAGVRYSIENPYVYVQTNVNGVLNLLELCKSHNVHKFILASTSALYAGQPMPFKETAPVNTPLSPYAASKKAAEALGYTYHYLYDIDITILRYFTVYGPAGRPDMSVFRFIKWIMEDKPIEIFGDGSQERDFTYIDDIVAGTIKALKPAGYEIINLGNNNPHKLNHMIELIEKYVGQSRDTARCVPTNIIYKDFHKADIKATCADITKAKQLLHWEPKVPLEDGIKKTVKWFRENWNWVKDVKL